MIIIASGALSVLVGDINKSRKNNVIKKIFNIALPFALLVWTSTALAANWFLVSSSNDNETYFIDASSIKPLNGQTTSAWIRVDLLKPKFQGLFKESAKNYMDNVTFQCKDEKFSTTDRVIYSVTGKSLETQHWQPNFISAAPNSIGGLVMKAACTRAASLSKGESISGLADTSLSDTSWRPISEDASSLLSIGLNNYEWGTAELDGVIFYLVRTDYKDLRKVGVEPYKTTVVQWAARCDNQNMFVTQDIYYSPGGQVIAKTEYDVTPGSIMKAPPNSVGSEMLKVACGEFPKTTKAQNKTNPKATAPAPQNDKGGYASGTAWQVSNNQLVTAFHVVNGAKSMGIAVNGEMKSARVIASDPSNDLALIQLTDTNLSTKPLVLASKPAQLGSRVAVLGYPLPDILGVKIQATTGEVSKLAGIRDDLRFYQISAAVQSGNSGGPLISSQGEVIGVVSSKLNAMNTLNEKGDLPQNVNFAVKYPYVSAMVESAGISTNKQIKKSNKIEDAITNAKESVYLLVVVLDEGK